MLSRDVRRRNPYAACSAPLASRVHYCTNADLVGADGLLKTSAGHLSQSCRKLAKKVEKFRQGQDHRPNDKALRFAILLLVF